MKTEMTVRQLVRLLSKVVLSYCVVYTVLSWTSILCPTQVGNFIDALDNYFDPAQPQNRMVIEPSKVKPKPKYTYV